MMAFFRVVAIVGTLVFGLGAHAQWTVREVVDLNPGSGSTDPIRLTPFEGKVGFVSTIDFERYFHVADTCAANLQDLFEVQPREYLGPDLIRAEAALGSIYFFDSRRSDAWISDGTTAGTTLASGNFKFPIAVYALGDKLLYVSPISGMTHGLYVSNGDLVGDELLITFFAPFSTPFDYTVAGGVVGNRVIVTIKTDETGTEYVASDGTPGGTGVIEEIEPGSVWYWRWPLHLFHCGGCACERLSMR